jgi:heterodisulfide reductase subunit A2
MTQKTTGAVMVVGGGIAGIQASLDLAEAGFKVYLVESARPSAARWPSSTRPFPPTTAPCASSRPSWWRPGVT